MNKIILVFAVLFTFGIEAQELKSPSAFHGYELGTQFARHHEVLDYYKYLTQARPDQVRLVEYGKTYERRPLFLVFISTAKNLENLESIRTAHIAATKGGEVADKAIVWLSYNVHGNESVSTEASMKTIYALLTTKQEYLEDTVIIMDPCINPDGRDRYSNWYNQFKNTPHQVDPNSKEHHEGWWTGRSNHYMFDLNRDWAWLTQVESQQRLKQYNQWLPHIHVDFHEQGVDNPYFFAPAAEPYHEVITPFQRDFQKTIGKNHAKYFDENGWFYFTKEVFDLFYPSYGDTYPTYSGAIGMTYEQGGSGRAGLGIKRKIGDTLTLKDRIAHHYTTGLSTIEVAAGNVERLNKEFKKFYSNTDFTYKSYVLSGNEDHIETLQSLLEKHEISYGSPTAKTVKGFKYDTGKSGSLSTTDKALVVSTDQTKGTMVKVLFEPNAKLSDSLTYDITAWSLPYAYGLNAVASTSLVNSQSSTTEEKPAAVPDSYAYITDWDSMKDARFLAQLLNEKINVRTTYAPLSLEGATYKRGSLIITKSDNQLQKDFLKILNKAVQQHHKKITPVKTGFVDSGKDFGSSYVQMIKKPKVAVLSGKPTSTLRFGEIWHFFEQQLHYPLTVIDTDYANTVSMEEYDILVLPDGNYGSYFTEARLKKLKTWVNNGGKVIAMGGAIAGIDGKNGFGIKTKKTEKDTLTAKPKLHKNQQRESIQNAITGAIFNTKVDNTHPLAFGYDTNYFTLKLGSQAFSYLKNGNAVYLEGDKKPVAGFAGSKALKKIQNTLIFGVESHGKGQVVYMVDNPLFRGFWENGKLFFANALFMVN